MTRGRMIAAVASVVTSIVLVGAGSALAGGGGGGGGLSREAARLADTAAIKAAVAKSLGTTTAKLNAAIKTSAAATIDAAVENDDITSDEAETLKEAIDDGTLPAIRYATTAGVAKALGTTAAKLNEAWDAAVTAQAKAKVDKALAAGTITEDEATAAKKRIDAATFKFGALGGPGGMGGKGGPGRHGRGFGPPRSGSEGGPTTTQSKARF